MAMYQNYRPQTFDDVFGQDDAVQLLKGVVEMPEERRPKVFLLEGCYGCGKTTLAHVFAKAIGVNTKSTDFQLMDASKDRSIDNIREFVDMFGTYPMSAKAQGRVYILDECHQLLAPAQEALLKKCEDTPPKTYIFFCTTDGSKLGKALRSRCKIIPIKAMTPTALYKSLRHVAGRIGYTPEQIQKMDAALQTIAKNSENSARTSMQIFESYLTHGDVDKAVSMQKGGSVKMEADVYKLCQAVINKSADWSCVKQFITAYVGQEEPVRIAILNYLNTCLLGARTDKDRLRFANIMECFIEPAFYAGKAGLTMKLARAWAVKG